MTEVILGFCQMFRREIDIIAGFAIFNEILLRSDECKG